MEAPNFGNFPGNLPFSCKFSAIACGLGPASGGDVERLFVQRGTISERQHPVDDDSCRPLAAGRCTGSYD